MATTSAAPAADVSADSSTAAPVTSTEPTQTLQERMRASLAKGRSAAAGSPPAADAARTDDASTSTEADSDAETTADPAGEGVEDATGKDEPKSIPFAAFQKRLGREQAKAREAQEQLQTERLAVRKAEKAVELIHGEYERLKQALAAGHAFDPRDEQLREYELGNIVREEAAKLLSKHQEELQQQSAQVEKQRYQSELRAEMQTALDAHPLLMFAELKKAMQTAQSLDATAVAAALQQKKLVVADKLRGTRATPAAPRSAKGASPGTTHQFETNQAGYSAYLAAKRAASS